MFKKLSFVPLFSVCLIQAFAYECIVTEFNQVVNATNTCQNISIVNLTVPGGVTLKLNLTDDTVVTFRGTTTFNYTAPWRGPLVTINGTNVTIQGDTGHVFDGQGQYYWDGRGDTGVEKPQFFTVQTFHSVMRNIYVLNSPHDVLQVTNSDRVSYYDWYINNTAGDPGVAPAEKIGKNTDGFDVWNSTNVLIRDAVVYNQDDCVALRCGSNISVYNMECHGTHGLSISVGFNNDTSRQNPLNNLTNVYFGDSNIYGGRNGIHIKTHSEGGYGLIENVFYENINITNTTHYGILIEENYPNGGTPRDNVPIINLLFEHIHGDIEPNATAVKVLCADDGCENWLWEDIDITGSTNNNTCNYKPFGTDVCDN